MLKAVFWGTYDLGKPRNRIILKGLKDHGVDVIECHASVWEAVEDKSVVKGVSSKIRLLARWLLTYPGLIYRYSRLPAHDIVLVGYLGQLDVLVLWPFARLRGVPIIWDAFLSLYNTVVEDRRMMSPKNPFSRALWSWEWLACRVADRVTLDTQAHAGYFRRTFGLGPDRLASFFVGAEDNFRDQEPETPRNSERPFTVLFYGQFIPLHGIQTIVEAAHLTREDDVRWILVGSGQEEGRIREMLDEAPLPHLDWIPWVPYEELRNLIAQADVCLGIFGLSEKAANVIPNKAFQVLAAGARLITMDSPAIRELVNESTPGIHLVPPGNAEALAAKVRELRKEVMEGAVSPFPPTAIRDAVGIAAVTRTLKELLESTALQNDGRNPRP